MIDVYYLWDAIYGNRELKKRLLSDISSDKLSHAFILEGPKNSGKLTLARTVAAAMSNHMQDVKKICGASSPDVIEITLPEKRKTLGVDSVREMKLAAYIKPNDLDFKLFIITCADLLTHQAQNALLKLIEEPPRRVYILLLCENAASLLPTIRSRAPIFRMEVFSPEELSSLLLQYSPDAQKLYAKDREAYDVIMRSSGGAYGEALRKIVDAEMKIGDLNYTVLEILQCICEKDRVSMLKKIQSLPPEREDFKKSLFLLRLAVRDTIAYRATRGECDYLFPKSEAIPSLAQKLSLERLLRINDLIMSLEKDAGYNPNVQNTKSVLYIGLCSV